MNYVANEPQKRVNILLFFVNLTNHEKVKEDFVYVFYDILKELRMIDLTVIRLYGRHYVNHDEERINSYADVLLRIISYEQYETVRRNLVRKGILTTKTDVIIEKDLVAIEKAIAELQNFVKKATDQKNRSRLPALKILKLKSKIIKKARVVSVNYI
ncbi:hypothetical protein BWGOE6_04030 [Bacillus mycoides]|uniref:hypothetical protein n=1 Tax=Bacillus mycoides TaxID=1405 RepID=UPI0008941B40|nr:hypothetical protein [Bacillus mycoides]OFD66078.1 hypothetical protein BWGOE6_04030 [Bacillus mycoides]